MVRNYQIKKGKIMPSFPALPHQTLSSGEFACQKPLCCLLKLDNEIRQWFWNQNNRL